MKKSSGQARGSIQFSGRAWLYGILALVVVIAVSYLSWSGSFLGARLTGPDVASLYTPLVRHVLASQTHCYDDGSQFCEKLIKDGGQKEFTVAYLFRQPPKGLATNQLFGCYNTRKLDYLVTTNSRDCKNLRLSSFPLGYLAKTDNFEASIQLFRCYSKDMNNYLVTDDRQECELSRHNNEIVELGWAAAGGHLPQRRLQGLCLAVDQANVLQDSYDSYCNTVEGLSGATHTPTPSDNRTTVKAGSPTPTAITTVAPAISWQNPKNKLDVNGDGARSPLDTLIVINTWNSKGARKLVSGIDSSPPYIDINGDGWLTAIDFKLISEL